MLLNKCVLVVSLFKGQWALAEQPGEGYLWVLGDNEQLVSGGAPWDVRWRIALLIPVDEDFLPRERGKKNRFSVM